MRQNISSKEITSGDFEFITHPIVFEKVYDHVDNGTVQDFLCRLKTALNSYKFNRHELRKLHWKCVIILLLKKYPDVNEICSEISTLRKQLNNVPCIFTHNLTQ